MHPPSQAAKKSLPIPCKPSARAVRTAGWTARGLILILCAFALLAQPRLVAAESLALAWTNNVLTVSGPELPGASFRVLWLEAFCRKGSTDRDWHETTITHRTELLSRSADGRRMRLRSTVGSEVEVRHDLRVRSDGIEFRCTLINHGATPVDLEWFEPCIQVERFTGRTQTNYPARCFIFTERGQTFLDRMPHTEEARYRGGQVYVPAGINRADVNPRPISPVTPANSLMGCVSFDDRYLLATAWDRTQHLFQGVIVCIHNDPHVGGLAAHETKHARGKIYFLKNDPAELLKKYRHDFPQ